jgi:hypothetical protein
LEECTASIFTIAKLANQTTNQQNARSNGFFLVVLFGSGVGGESSHSHVIWYVLGG